MIVGVGTDVVSIQRIEKIWQRFGERFLHRLLTTEEQADKGWNAARLARRWALKEAVAKALGTGIGAAVSFQDIQVTYTPSGRPQVRVNGQAGLRVDASVSDDETAGVALAFCVIGMLG